MPLVLEGAATSESDSESELESLLDESEDESELSDWVSSLSPSLSSSLSLSDDELSVESNGDATLAGSVVLSGPALDFVFVAWLLTGEDSMTLRRRRLLKPVLCFS